MNNLYWLTEELKSYTDLSGNRFDIERARRILLKMKPFLLNYDSSQFKLIYENLDELSSHAMFFEKSEFSKKVDELFAVIEKEKSE
ncbi:MAG: hypothetical protein ACI94Y_002011 [Maribacter sp.]|jgi:hypothetical protein